MASITIKGVPNDLMDRLRSLAAQERRSINQQTIRLLEEALAEKQSSFRSAYDSFRATHGPSPFEEEPFSEVRSGDTGREVEP